MGNAQEWYVRSEGKIDGPLSSNKLKEMAKGEQINLETEVARTNEGPWYFAAKINGLFPENRTTGIPPENRAECTPKSNENSQQRRIFEYLNQSSAKQHATSAMPGLDLSGRLGLILDGRIWV